MRSSPLARRAPLRQRTPLARGKAHLQRKAEPERKTRLRQFNPERRKKLFARNYGEDGKHGAWIREQPCAVQAFSAFPSPCSGRHEAAHASDRGMGGCKGDRKALFCACSSHHGEHGAGHQTFEHRYQINCQDIAAQMWAESPYGAAWEAEREPA